MAVTCPNQFDVIRISLQWSIAVPQTCSALLGELECSGGCGKRLMLKRSAASGFTAEIIQAREAYISGRSELAELTATAQSCVSLWENGFALSDVEGTDLLDSSAMALVGRALAVRGECVLLISQFGLVPCSDWDLRTRFATAHMVFRFRKLAEEARRQRLPARCCIQNRLRSSSALLRRVTGAPFTLSMLHSVEARLRRRHKPRCRRALIPT